LSEWSVVTQKSICRDEVSKIDLTFKKFKKKIFALLDSDFLDFTYFAVVTHKPTAVGEFQKLI